MQSPLAGVGRPVLVREAAEFGRATSVVKYEPESFFFATHTQRGGKEFLFLGGVLYDEIGDFGHGMCVRNLIGSCHQTHSKDGCTILVKLS